MLNICIEDMNTVQSFFCFLKQNGLTVSLHADIDFRDLIAGRRLSSLSLHQAMYLNDLLTASYAVCERFGADIYSVFQAECPTSFHLS